jgi:ATP-dependent DNA ligase
VLESLFADHELGPPWMLCPMTTDPALEREWLEEWTQVPGLEGIVTKRLASPYSPGARGWSKLRRRQTTEAVIGGVTGSLHRPQLLVLGRHDAEGQLRSVGRTTPLSLPALHRV